AKPWPTTAWRSKRAPYIPCYAASSRRDYCAASGARRTNATSASTSSPPTARKFWNSCSRNGEIWIRPYRKLLEVRNMQLVDSKLYSANMPRFHAGGDADVVGELTERREGTRLLSRLAGSRASERLLAVMLTAFVVTASPAMLATVRSTVSLSFQILL